MSRFPYIAVTVPSLVLAVVGVTHPSDLTAQSAEYWRNLHIGILAVFPLLAFAPWLVVRGRDAIVSWTVGILGFLFAAFYTALDVLAGIGAGGLEFDGHGDVVGTVFRLGNNLGDIGSYAFIAACLVAGGFTVKWTGPRAIPGALLVLAGSVLFLERHIYFPVGVAGQLCLAAGWVALLVASRRKAS
jgi:hypothetical protein